MQDCNYIYAILFNAGGDSGIALVSARSYMDALQVLKNGGRFNAKPSTYTVLKYRNIGLSTGLRTEILMEAYTNAEGVYDRLMATVDCLKGDKGDAAGFGTVAAYVDANVGIPSVEVSVSGPDTAKVFTFNFHNLKGEKGDTVNVQWGTITGDISNQADLQTVLEAKQDTIDDLSTIRSGAEAGAEAAYREYDSENPSGLGYKVLDKETFFSSQVTEENAIYEIRYDYDLGGGTVEIPEGCVLKFVGGSVKNGTLSGVNTVIEADKITIFNDITITGSWNVSYIYAGWFGLEENENNTTQIRSAMALANNDYYNTIEIPEGSYNVEGFNPDDSFTYKPTFHIPSNTKLINNAVLSVISHDNARGIVFFVYNRKNVEITGGKIIGDVDAHTYTGGGSHEWNYGICVRLSENVRIHDIEITKFVGDALNLADGVIGYHNKNIVIEDVVMSHSGRTNFVISDGIDVLVERCSMLYAGVSGGKSSKTGIDIEPSYSDGKSYVKNITIQNCTVAGNTSASIVLSNIASGIGENVVFRDVFVDTDLRLSDVIFPQYGELLFEHLITNSPVFLTTVGSESRLYVKGVRFTDTKLSYWAGMDTEYDRISFERCSFESGTNDGWAHGIIDVGTYSQEARTVSGVSFTNCTITYKSDAHTNYSSIVRTSSSNNGLSFYGCSFILNKAVSYFSFRFDAEDCEFELNVGSSTSPVRIYTGTNARILKNNRININGTGAPSAYFTVYPLTTATIDFYDNIVTGAESSGAAVFNNNSTGTAVTINIRDNIFPAGHGLPKTYNNITYVNNGTEAKSMWSKVVDLYTSATSNIKLTFPNVDAYAEIKFVTYSSGGGSYYGACVMKAMYAFSKGSDSDIVYLDDVYQNSSVPSYMKPSFSSKAVYDSQEDVFNVYIGFSSSIIRTKCIGEISYLTAAPENYTPSWDKGATIPNTVNMISSTKGGSTSNRPTIPATFPDGIGYTYYDTTLGKQVVWNGSSWDVVTPDVPVISTDISADASSDTNTASPKAVKDYVDNIVGDIETLLAAL